MVEKNLLRKYSFENIKCCYHLIIGFGLQLYGWRKSLVILFQFKKVKIQTSVVSPSLVQICLKDTLSTRGDDWCWISSLFCWGVIGGHPLKGTANPALKCQLWLHTLPWVIGPIDGSLSQASDLAADLNSWDIKLEHNSKRCLEDFYS